MRFTEEFLPRVALLATWLVAPWAQGGVSLTTLFSFNGTNGASPYGALVQGANGNFYGTTAAGGANGQGAVFQMSPSGGLAAVVSFNRTNGAAPVAALLQGTNGDFYGTTYAGGAAGFGTVFTMTTNGQLTMLASFVGTNGIYPKAGLIQGRDGNFYGTTAIGGANSQGTVFRLSNNGTLTTLASFDSGGSSPYAGLLQGPDGNFYGTTYQGGSNGYGTIFMMTPGGTLTNLHAFTGAGDGGNPYAEVVLGPDGGLYGTTHFGGASGYGTVFRTTTNGAVTTLVSFGNPNGAYPQARLLLGADGSFYGTTLNGGAYTDESGIGYGTVFKLTTNGVLTTLISFNSTNGAYPQAALLQSSNGNFYGTTANGGSTGNGTVFRLNLAAPPPPVIQTVTLTGATLTLTWSATVGQTYQVQDKTNLNQTDWNNLGSVIPATNATMTILDTLGSDPQRFNRVVLLP